MTRRDPAAIVMSELLRTLLVVDEAGSFSAAARMLGLNQSSVSRQIRNLEDQIGVSLFERSSSGLRATDAGRALLGRMRHITGLARVAVEEASDAGAARAGWLRWGFVGSFTNPPAREVLSRIREQHPELKLQLTEAGATELVQKVMTHELDCAWIGSWRSPDPALVLEPLWTDPLYLAVPEDLPGIILAQWRDLSGRVLLARSGAELDLLFPVLDAAGVARPEVQFHYCARDSLMAMVAAGQLDREVAAFLAGGLLPGGAELGLAGEDAEVGGLVVLAFVGAERRLLDVEGGPGRPRRGPPFPRLAGR